MNGIEPPESKSKLCIDMGSYPLLPWLHSKSSSKKFFHPPETNEEVIIAIRNEKTFKYECPNMLTEIYLHTNSSLAIDDLIHCIDKASELLLPFE